MFPDSITLHATVDRTVSKIDTDNGRSQYRLNMGGGVFTDFAIAHQETSENKPVNTDRHLVRVDLIREDEVTHKPVKVSAGLFLAVPRSVTTQADAEAVLAQLLNFFLTKGDTEPAQAVTEGHYQGVLQRLLNGES